jgi:hypothetical protein
MILRGREWNVSGNQHLPLYVFTTRLVDFIALSVCVGIHDDPLEDLHWPWHERRTLCGWSQYKTKTSVCRKRSAEHRTSAVSVVEWRTRCSGPAEKISLGISPTWVWRLPQGWSYFNEPSVPCFFLPSLFWKPLNPRFTTPASPSHGRLIF